MSGRAGGRARGRRHTRAPFPDFHTVRAAPPVYTRVRAPLPQFPAMDPAVLYGVLASTLSPDNALRRAAEKQLIDVSRTRGAR